MRHDDILELLRQKIADVSIERARQDVLPFIRVASVLDVWSKTLLSRLSKAYPNIVATCPALLGWRLFTLATPPPDLS